MNKVTKKLVEMSHTNDIAKLEEVFASIPCAISATVECCFRYIGSADPNAAVKLIQEVLSNRDIKDEMQISLGALVKSILEASELQIVVSNGVPIVLEYLDGGNVDLVIGAFRRIAARNPDTCDRITCSVSDNDSHSMTLSQFLEQYPKIPDSNSMMQSYVDSRTGDMRLDDEDAAMADRLLGINGVEVAHGVINYDMIRSLMMINLCNAIDQHDAPQLAVKEIASKLERIMRLRVADYEMHHSRYPSSRVFYFATREEYWSFINRLHQIRDEILLLASRVRRMVSIPDSQQSVQD